MSANERPTDVIVPGEKIFLGRIRRSDRVLYRGWLNDLTTASMLGTHWDSLGYPMTTEDQDDWFEAVRRSRTVAAFTIHERRSGDAIGNVSLSGLLNPDRTAEIVVGIGDRSRRRKGYGTEAVSLALDFGFTVLSLHRISAQCLAINPAGLKVLERNGFREFGRAREARTLAGQRHDVVMLDILRSEFNKPLLKAMLDLDEQDS